MCELLSFRSCSRIASRTQVGARAITLCRAKSGQGRLVWGWGALVVMGAFASVLHTHHTHPHQRFAGRTGSASGPAGARCACSASRIQAGGGGAGLACQGASLSQRGRSGDRRGGVRATIAWHMGEAASPCRPHAVHSCMLLARSPSPIGVACSVVGRCASHFGSISILSRAGVV